jgi:DNA-binding protein H-NS
VINKNPKELTSMQIDKSIEGADIAPTKSLFASANSTESPDAIAEETPVEPVEELEADEEQAETETVQADSPDTMAVDATGTESSDDSEQTFEEAQAEHEAEEAAPVDEPADNAAATATDTPTTKEPTEEPKEESVEALQAQKAAVDKKLTTKQLEERKSVISQIAAVVKTYDIPIKDLVKALGGIPSPRKGMKAPITHRDKNGNTWSGRGKLPKWLKGKNPDDYRV